MEKEGEGRGDWQHQTGKHGTVSTGKTWQFTLYQHREQDEGKRVRLRTSGGYKHNTVSTWRTRLKEKDEEIEIKRDPPPPHTHTHTDYKTNNVIITWFKVLNYRVWRTLCQENVTLADFLRLVLHATWKLQKTMNALRALLKNLAFLNY